MPSRCILLPLLLGLLASLPTHASEPYLPASPWQGEWLSNEEIKVFVATEPRLRLLHISEPGGENLLRDRDDDVTGIKTGYLAPGHRPDSFAVGDQPGSIIRQDARSLTLETGIEKNSQLSLRWHLEIAPDAPSLTLEHTLTNHADAAREIAVWSLAAVPSEGQVQVDQFEDVFLLGGQPLGTAANQLMEHLYVINFDAPIHPYILRTGIYKSEPKFLYRSERGSFRSSVAEKEGPWSPPGINLLFYTDVSPQEQFAELEHLGPRRKVQPGESLSLTQVIKLFDEKITVTADDKQARQLELSYNLQDGVEATEAGSLIQWVALIEKVPLALKPLSPERAPQVSECGLQFNNSPLEIPRIAPLQGAGPDAPRSVEVTFSATDHHPASPQMLIEIGGSGNGYNLWLQDGQLHAGVWGKDDAGEVTAEFMQAPLPTGQTTAGLKILPANQLAELWLNGSKVAESELPSIMPHRDRCALGGVAGTSRLRTGVVKAGAAPLKGQVSALNIQWGAAEQSSN